MLPRDGVSSAKQSSKMGMENGMGSQYSGKGDDEMYAWCQQLKEDD